MPGVACALVVCGSAVVIAHAIGRRRLEARLAALGAWPGSAKGGGVRDRFANWARSNGGSARQIRAVAGAAVGAVLGFRLAGAPGVLVGTAVTVGGVRTLDRRRTARKSADLERQLAVLVEACAMAVRGGSSVAQALAVGAEEAEEPMRSLANAAVARQRLGASFDEALAGLAASIGTEDARLFALVMAIHHRSGGNVAAPLREVGETIRHRISVRRELRALSAQGRISGVVLGTLPIGFFVVLSATSHHDLAPVYRSPAGASMVVGGLVLDGLAYAWIRHLLKVEV